MFDESKDVLCEFLAPPIFMSWAWLVLVMHNKILRSSELFHYKLDLTKLSGAQA